MEGSTGSLVLFLVSLHSFDRNKFEETHLTISTVAGVMTSGWWTKANPSESMSMLHRILSHYTSVMPEVSSYGPREAYFEDLQGEESSRVMSRLRLRLIGVVGVMFCCLCLSPKADLPSWSVSQTIQ